MKLFLLLALVGAVLAKESYLKAVLRSPGETLLLYDEFKTAQHLAFDSAEDKLRFRLFRKNAELVADENSVDGETAEFALNFFTTMTEAEQLSYRGLNVTGHDKNAEAPLKSSGVAAASTKLWTNEGKVTEVENQGACGSCWTYGAVGGLETRYARIAGVLRKFSEQEYLDCVYEGRHNGCQGGWPNDCYTYSKINGGRLASEKNYGYTGRDGACRGSIKPDAMVAAKIKGIVYVPASEASNIRALEYGALSVAFEVTNRFQTYSRGIFRDTTCNGRPNHAVTAVGYTPEFVLVKNSWGTTWGDKGFVKFTRNYHNCHLWNYSSYPRLDATGASDNGGSDSATDYRAGDNDDAEPEPTCENSYKGTCYERWCKTDWIAEDYCQKTCNNCPKKDCPSGTTKCPDGVCRHEHMC